MSDQKQTSTPKKKATNTWTAVRHKSIPGPRVIKTSVYKAHLAKNKGQSIFIELGTAATKALAIELCNSSTTV